MDTGTQNKNLKVVISLYPTHIKEETKLKLSLLPTDKEDFDHDYPILILSYISNSSHHQDTKMKSEKENGTKRKKRFIEEDYEDESNNIWDELLSRKNHEKKLKRLRNVCKRKPLYVDFAEINYDEWIVQPRGYEVG